MDASPLAQLIDRRAMLRGITVGAASLASMLAVWTTAPTSRTAGAPPRRIPTPPTNTSALEAGWARPTSASAAGRGTGFPVTLPYVPAVAPDIPGTPPLVDDAYLRYPAQPRPMFARPLGSGRPLEAAISDGINDIIAGRRPMSDYDVLLTDWRSNGGEIIRHEYLELMTAARSS